MNEEDVFSLADKAGLGFVKHADPKDIVKFKRFADLVASAEREACAKECDIQASFGNDDERFGARQCGYVIRARGQA